jgi:hypothetical protein
MKQENNTQQTPYLRELISIFSENSRERAHELSRPVLKAMASDRAFFETVIKQNLSDPDFLNSLRDYEKLLKFKVSINPDFSLVMNIFPPCGKQEKISVKSIHHHQNLILTTVNTFGPGYESVLFKKDIHINRTNLKATLELDEQFFHEPEKVRTIDCFVPHVVFFPDTVTATYALWSMNRKRKIEYLKGSPAIEKIKPVAVKTANFIGLGNILGLNDASEVYFYVKNQSVFLLKHKLKYPKGTNECFLSSMFCFLKETGFSDYDFLRKVKEDPRVLPHAKMWINKFLRNEHDAFSFEETHVMIPEENIRKSDIMTAVNDNHLRYPTESGMPILNKFEAGF